MHGPDERDHLVQRLGGRLHDDVDAVAQDVEVEVRDQRCDLDQRVVDQVEAGHLAVDPHQSFVHEGQHYVAPATPAALSLRSGHTRSLRPRESMGGAGRAPRRRRCVDLRRRDQAPRPRSERGRGACLRAAPRGLGRHGGPPAARAGGRGGRDAGARRPGARRRRRVGAAVRGVHHRHRVGLGARHRDRLRLLRWRRLRPRRHLEVPLGDRPRRRRCSPCRCSWSGCPDRGGRWTTSCSGPRRALEEPEKK